MNYWYLLLILWLLLMIKNIKYNIFRFYFIMFVFGIYFVILVYYFLVSKCRVYKVKWCNMICLVIIIVNCSLSSWVEVVFKDCVVF